MTGSRTVTVIGGGIAGLETVLALRALLDGVPIELVAPRVEADFRPLAVLEPFSMGEMPSLDLERFAAEQHASLRRDTLVAVEPGERAFVTGKGERLPYDVLVIAAGASAVEAIPGAITFRGHEDQRAIGLLVDELARGELRWATFAIPEGQAWSLPAYELALLTAASLRARGASGIELGLVTPEREPLEMFGAEASRAMRELLELAGISLRVGIAPARVEHGELVTAPGERIWAGRVVTLPRLLGPRFRGLPSTGDGFIPTDAHGRVQGLEDVYAAGDATAFPVKQGGLATQQADAVAEHIAAQLGAGIEPHPFEPVLRGFLYVGATARQLEQGAAPEVRPALFAASRKVMGRYLVPYLTGREAEEPSDGEGALRVELDLEPLRPQR